MPTERTQVVIIGAGPAGLTLAALLRRAAVDCVVLEQRDRTRVEQRQRAGILDATGAQIFADAGLADEVLAGAPRETQLEIRLDGVPRLFDAPRLTGGRTGVLVPQQLLVRRLLTLLEAGGADLRFEAGAVRPYRIGGERALVGYRGPDGREHELECDFVAGCDGFHGVSRAALPAEVVTEYRFDHGIGWYTILADAPPPRLPLMAVSRHGYAAHFARGPHASRFYLQYDPATEDPRDWPDEKAFELLRLRLGDPGLAGGAITEREVVEMRSFVVEPMAHERLFLAGDAAHIITPMGAKGMNLALADAALLARALIAQLTQGDGGPLAQYSDACLRRTWDYQDFSRWFTEMVHDAGDERTSGPFRRKLALARLNRLWENASAARAFADLMSGTPLGL